MPVLQLSHLKKHAAVVALAMSVVPSLVTAGDVERVPEVDGFVKMSDVMRLYFNGRITTVEGGGVTQTELGAHLDITLIPILRLKLREADWERDRYLWARVGYEVFARPDDQGNGPTERRLLTELTAQAPLWRPSSIWLVCRLRIDFRDLRGAYSKRYRYRMGVQREIPLNGGRSLIPYVQAEILYDTRYDAWNRRIYQVGLEVKMAPSWRLEPYVSRQRDDRSASANVNRIGLRLKVYW